MTLARLAARLREGELSPREAVELFVDRIDAFEPHVNAYIHVRAEEALLEADALGRSSVRGPLWGVPLAVKDMIDLAGVPTSAGSKMLAHEVAHRDAPVIERLKAAGAIVLGKLNLHEFAFSALGSEHFGVTHNPWSLDHFCSGSSSGSAAAIAADLCAGTLGTDTAGSVRIPACFCGVTGLRPSTGRVPNRGVIPVSRTFDTVGPIAHTAADCALLLEAIAGYDSKDPTTVDVPVPAYSKLLGDGVSGLKIGAISTLFDKVIDSRIQTMGRDALREFESLGAKIADVDTPLIDEADTTMQAIMFGEAAEVHLEWLRSRQHEYGTDVRSRLLVGLFLPSTTYVTAQRARRFICEQFRGIFWGFDLLAAPTMPILPPRLGRETRELYGRPDLYRLGLTHFGALWSMLGVPAISVPCGFVDGLPVGLTIAGPRLAEAVVLRAAHAFQLVTNWHDLRPTLPLATGRRLNDGGLVG